MNGMINSNTENNERGLLPHQIILAANKGEAEATKLNFGKEIHNENIRE